MLGVSTALFVVNSYTRNETMMVVWLLNIAMWILILSSKE